MFIKYYDLLYFLQEFPHFYYEMGDFLCKNNDYEGYFSLPNIT